MWLIFWGIFTCAVCWNACQQAWRLYLVCQLTKFVLIEVHAAAFLIVVAWILTTELMARTPSSIAHPRAIQNYLGAAAAA